MHIVDRRLNPKSKSLGNRQRFMRRAKADIRDAVRMEQVFAPDVFPIGQSGRKHEREQLWNTARVQVNAVLPVPDLQIRLPDELTALVTYSSAVTYDDVTESGRRSSIWMKQPTGWVWRFHQGTPFIPCG